MEFDVSKVYTALNADELKVGSKVIVSDYLANLKLKVKTYQEENVWIISDICSETLIYRFMAHKYDSDCLMCFALAYLIEEPSSYRCYLNRKSNMFDWRNDPFITSYIYAKFATEEEAKDWCTEHQKFVEVAKTWEEGKQIQFCRHNDFGTEWIDCKDNSPAWCIDVKYRVKPEQKPLRWKDLEVGDVLKDAVRERIVIEKDYDVSTDFHILAGSKWMSDDDLSECILVRRAKVAEE